MITMGEAGAFRFSIGLRRPGWIAVRSSAKSPHWCTEPDTGLLPGVPASFPA